MRVALYGRALPDGHKSGLLACVAAFAQAGVEVVLYNRLAEALQRLGENWTGPVFGDSLPEMGNKGFYRDWETDRKSTRLNSSHSAKSRMPSSA